MPLPRISTGIPGLDSKIRGGIPENSVVLLYGPPKCGKTILSTQFFYEGLKKEEPGVYITTNSSVKQLKQTMFSFNLSPEQAEEKGLCFYIDLFSIRNSADSRDTEIVKNVMPTALTQLMITISEGFKFLCPKCVRVRTIFDSLNVLVETNIGAVSRGIQSLVAKSKSANSATLLVYTEGTANKEIETRFKSFVDGVIYMDGKGNLTVESMPDTPCPIKAKYQITDSGIKVS